METTIFERLAEQENGTCTIEHNKYWGKSLSRLIVTRYLLDIKYKEHQISVVNELGNMNLAKFHCELLPNLELSVFSTNNKSHFWRLFNSNSNILTVESKDQYFQKIIQSKLHFLRVEQLARDYLFEPKTKGRKKEGIYSVTTTYHLEFPNKELVLEPLINFYKFLIDYAIDNGERLRMNY